MRLLLTIISALTTFVLIAGGIMLWMRRKETNDYSRHVLAIFCWFTSLNSFIFIIRHWVGNTIINELFLDPEHTFVSLIMQMTFFCYPLARIKYIIRPGRTCLMLFVPPIAILVIGMFSGIEYTSLNASSDIWHNIWRPDVMYRMFAAVTMLAYAFALFLVPYDLRKSGADKKYILKYSLGFCSIGVLLFMGFMTHAKTLLVMHQMSVLVFLTWVIWSELRDRLPMPDVMEENNSLEPYNVIDRIWVGITHVVIENQGWRDPDLSLESLSEELGSNRTYVGEAFKKFAGCTFSEYIARCRIEYVVSELKKNPQANLQKIFSHAGFRQRSTAYRNFQRIMGISPTEYMGNLK